MYGHVVTRYAHFFIVVPYFFLKKAEKSLLSHLSSISSLSKSRATHSCLAYIIKISLIADLENRVADKILSKRRLHNFITPPFIYTGQVIIIRLLIIIFCNYTFVSKRSFILNRFLTGSWFNFTWTKQNPLFPAKEWVQQWTIPNCLHFILQLLGTNWIELSKANLSDPSIIQL